jgi:hypothetical protein
MGSPCHSLVAFRCACALVWCLFLGGASAHASSLADVARESGCTTKPVQNGDSKLFRCTTKSGEAFFNVPDSRSGISSGPGKSEPSPSSFPRVDANTQKSRDDMRKKVLNDELASEEKQLAEARAAYGNGAPTPLPDEKADAEKYRQRIDLLRQTVQLHERNVEALKKELAR